MAMFQIGVKRINANLASIIISMNPLFTMIFAKFIVDEPFTKKKALVLVISFAGLVIVVNPATLIGGTIDVTGLLITVGAAVSFGLYTAMGKKRIAKLGGMVENAVSFLLGSAVLLVFMAISGTPVLGRDQYRDSSRTAISGDLRDRHRLLRLPESNRTVRSVQRIHRIFHQTGCGSHRGMARAGGGDHLELYSRALW